MTVSDFRTAIASSLRRSELARVLPLALVGLVFGLALARLPVLEATLLVGLTLALLMSLFEPLAGLVIALFAGVGAAWLRAELPHIPALLGQYLVIAVVAIWLVRGLVRRDLNFPTPPLLWPLLGFLGVALLSLWQPTDVWVSFTEWAKWGQLLLIFLITYDRLVARAGVTAPGVLAALLGVGVLQAALGLWQYTLRGDGPTHFMIGAGLYRAYGTFEQPNPYGGFVGMLAALGVGLAAVVVSDAFRQRRWPPVWLWPLGGATLLLGAALGASWSRGAWLGFGAALLAIVVLLPRRGAWGLLLAALVMGGGLGLYATGQLHPALAVRLTGFMDYLTFSDVRGVGINDANYAVLERMAHWQAALEMWRANFWLGVGLGGYEPAYPVYRLINWPHALGHAHNTYLTLLAETGLLGLLAYSLLLGTLFWRLWRLTCVLHGWQRGVAVGVFGLWVQFAVHNFVDNLLVNNVHLLMGMSLGVAGWLSVKREL